MSNCVYLIENENVQSDLPISRKLPYVTRPYYTRPGDLSREFSATFPARVMQNSIH